MCLSPLSTLNSRSLVFSFLYDFVHIPSFAKTLWPSYKACQSAVRLRFTVTSQTCTPPHTLLLVGGSPQVCLGSTLPYFFPVNETAAGIKYSTAEAALSKAMVYYTIERSSSSCSLASPSCFLASCCWSSSALPCTGDLSHKLCDPAEPWLWYVIGCVQSRTPHWLLHHSLSLCIQPPKSYGASSTPHR